MFLVGRRGAKQLAPPSYQALARLFARRCERLGIWEPWMTDAACAAAPTRPGCGRAGCASSPSRSGSATRRRSPRAYTRVSDHAVLAEYRRALGLADGEARP